MNRTRNMRRRALTLIAALLAPLWLSMPVSAASPDDGWLLQSEVGLRGSGDGRFGRTVAVAGEWMAVGATLGPDPGINTGAVFLFHRENGIWTAAGNLVNPDPQAQASFGAAIAMSGTHLVVGEPFYSSGSLASTGRVLFYELDPASATWNLITSYSYNQAGAYTGYAVAIDGSTAMVGLPGANVFAPPQDAAGGVVGWTFAGTHWNSMGLLIQGNNPLENDFFGASVAVHVNNGSARVVVGAPSRTPNPNLDNSGAAYVFDVSVGSATQIAFLTAPNIARVDSFGAAVGYGHGARVFIGAPGRDYNGQQAAGVVFVFAPVAGGYGAESLVSRGTDAHFGDQFGTSLAYDETSDVLAVGAPGEDGLVADEGAAHIFHPYIGGGGGTLWAETAKLSLADLPHDADALGSALALDNGHAYVGAPLVAAGGQSAQGRVYVFASDLIFADGLD
ncbi:MAG: hypothetical protein WBV61_01610 [Rhodanobacteraceae bacterium]